MRNNKAAHRVVAECGKPTDDQISRRRLPGSPMPWRPLAEALAYTAAAEWRAAPTRAIAAGPTGDAWADGYHPFKLCFRPTMSNAAVCEWSRERTMSPDPREGGWKPATARRTPTGALSCSESQSQPRRGSRRAHAGRPWRAVECFSHEH